MFNWKLTIVISPVPILLSSRELLEIPYFVAPVFSSSRSVALMSPLLTTLAAAHRQYPCRCKYHSNPSCFHIIQSPFCQTCTHVKALHFFCNPEVLLLSHRSVRNRKVRKTRYFSKFLRAKFSSVSISSFRFLICRSTPFFSRRSLSSAPFMTSSRLT